jgi:Anti-sigma-K factor rskA
VIDSHPIDCLECQTQLAEFALDELPERMRAPIAAHLESGCLACNEQLAELLSGFSKLAYALPAHQPAARIEQDLLDRIAVRKSESRRVGTFDSRPETESRKRAIRRLVVTALALAASVIGIALWSNWHTRSSQGFVGSGDWAAVRRRVERANAAEQFAVIPQLSFASLRQPSARSAAQGYVVVDRFTKQWHVYVFHLPAPAQDHRYHLWIDLGDSRFQHLGEAEIDSDGTLARVISVPADVVDPRGLAISDEAGDAPDHPTGENVVEAPLR